MYSGTATLDDAGATLAVEVSSLLNPGADPTAQPSVQVVDLYAASGEIVWQDAGSGAPITLTAPAHTRLGVEMPASDEQVEIPLWVTADDVTPGDKMGSEVIADHLTVDGDVVQGLQELTEHRRSEVAALAIRSLGSIGVFEPLVTALGDESWQKRDVWSHFIESLKTAAARSPETATAIRGALESTRGPESKELFRMLWGYTDADLKAGQAARLVKYLDSDDLDFRVLSFWNLRDITGIGLFYRPEYVAQKRQQPVQKWRQKLAAGEIVAARPAAEGRP
jgi:hypothetical protein